jgi:peptide/nickel transport system substrate-binding protein
MAGAGITLSIETLPPDALRERRAQGDYDLFINAWVADTADPDNLYSTHLYAGPDNPLHRVHIPELDRLIEESVSTPVRGERARAYRRIQRIEREQMPCIPVMHSSLPVILRRGISGMRITTGSYLIFRNTVKTAPADRAQQRPAP